MGDHDLAKSAPAFKRQFYTPVASVTKLSSKEVDARREELGITLEAAPDGTNFTPVAEFSEAGFSKDVLAATANFKKPSPIQAQSWPIVLSGHDMVGIAATGSGKTMAFGLPALMQILAQPKCAPGSPQCPCSRPPASWRSKRRGSSRTRAPRAACVVCVCTAVPPSGSRRSLCSRAAGAR